METVRYGHNFGRNTIYFEEDFRGITPLVKTENVPIPEVLTEAFSKLLQSYQVDAEKIQKKCGENLGSLETLDFSNLGLTQLPPHILLECTNAKHLDISGNNIFFLPVQLQLLNLATLDISGNKRLQPNIPDWLGIMSGLTLTANDIGLDFIPRGFEKGRFISNELPNLLWDFGETQQDLT